MPKKILIYDDIAPDWGVSAGLIADQLAVIDGDDVHVHISSGGGDVYEGLAIMNQLRAHPGEVTAIIEGLAASAASFIAIGGADKVICRPNAEIMIHEAWSMHMGNADDLEKAAADLDRVSANLAQIYADKSGGDADTFREAMKAETWYSAEEALEEGLVDAVEDARTKDTDKPAARGKSRVMAHFKYRDRAAAPEPTTAPEGHKRNNMSILNELAEALGTTADDLKNKLGLDTPQGDIDVTYPAVTVAPGESVTVEVNGTVLEGTSFTDAAAPDGWDAEVDNDTGEVIITAPDSADDGDEATIAVTAENDDDQANLEITVTVAAPAEDEGEDDGTNNAASNTIEIDADVYADLMARAEAGDRAAEKDKTTAAANLIEEEGIKAGRILGWQRQSWIDRAVEDYDKTKKSLMSLASGTVNLNENGRGGSDEQRAAAEESKDRANRSRGTFRKPRV